MNEITGTEVSQSQQSRWRPIRRDPERPTARRWHRSRNAGIDALSQGQRSSKAATTATAPSAIWQRIRIPRPRSHVTPMVSFATA